MTNRAQQTPKDSVHRRPVWIRQTPNLARSSVTSELHHRHLTCLLCFRLQSACFPIGCFIPCDNVCSAFLCVPTLHKRISEGKYWTCLIFKILNRGSPNSLPSRLRRIKITLNTPHTTGNPGKTICSCLVVCTPPLVLQPTVNHKKKLLQLLFLL